MPLLSRAADLHATNDQLLVLFRRKVAEDSHKVQEFRRLSSELREVVRMRDRYINELKLSNSCDEILESIEIMRRMQLDDIEKASRLLLMARETQLKMHVKKTFIIKMRGLRVDSQSVNGDTWRKMLPVSTGYCILDLSLGFATGGFANKVGDPVSHANL
ncbi:hypothetical protein Tco_1442029 [Tanacetum coccineum]